MEIKVPEVNCPSCEAKAQLVAIGGLGGLVFECARCFYYPIMCEGVKVEEVAEAREWLRERMPARDKMGG